MTYKTAQDVMVEYINTGNFWYPYYCSMNIEEGTLEVLVVESDSGYDVWNIHPLRKGWQLVYSLEKCDPLQKLHESIASLKRLYEI